MIVIYGSSDDLVEVEGDISEEFDYGYDDQPSFLAFSDGTVLRITYDGLWHIVRVAEGTAEMHHTPASTTSDDGEREDGSPAYSDRLTLCGHITWAIHGKNFETRS